MLTKSDFLKTVPRQLILVDHNELTQAVHGADRLPIIEVLDHHRLGGFSTDSPIHFWNNPVGSTCTIVALLYRQNGIDIPPGTAGLLMAGLISDTLNLTSPTATPTDRTILAHLSELAGVDAGTLASEIFSVGSPLLTLQPGEVVTSDCKEYVEAGARFSVAQIEELGFQPFYDKQGDLAAALGRLPPPRTPVLLHAAGHGHQHPEFFIARQWVGRFPPPDRLPVRRTGPLAARRGGFTQETTAALSAPAIARNACVPCDACDICDLNRDFATISARKFARLTCPPLGTGSRPCLSRYCENNFSRPARPDFPAVIEVKQLKKTFGRYPALNGVDLRIETGELIALLGPSGSGKTTLLRLIAGLEFADADGGEILFDGEPVSDRPVGQRGVGFVFQSYALFRHLSVFENVAFGLRVRPSRTRPKEADLKTRVNDLLQLVQLGDLGKRYPAQLSGGQRQRVALARALAIDPSVLLLDEPFGALDAKVRKDLRRWLRELQKRLGLTTVFVTHDQEEALEIADRVVVMSTGRIEQIGTSREVYDHPATPFRDGISRRREPARGGQPGRQARGVHLHPPARHRHRTPVHQRRHAGTGRHRQDAGDPGRAGAGRVGSGWTTGSTSRHRSAAHGWKS